MKVTIEKIDEINLLLSGSVDNARIVEKALSLKEAAAKIPKELDAEGKAIEKSDETFAHEAEGEILKEFIEVGLTEGGINVDTILGQPGFKKYEKNDEGIYLEIHVSTSPEIDTSVDYKSIIPPFVKVVVEEEQIQAKLAELAAQQAPLVSLETPRALENDDTAIIDFEGFIDGKPFEGGKAEQFSLKIGSGQFIPGFEEQLVGMAYGEERSITLSFPDDYSAPDLAGKETVFEVKLHEIKEQKVVEPDDDFAKTILNDENVTLDTLKGNLARQIESEELSVVYNEDLKPKLMEGLLKIFNFTLPSNVVEQEIDAIITEKAQVMSDAERKSLQEDKEKFHALRDSVREEASNTIKIALIVEALAKKEGIDVHEQEVLSALYYQAMMSGQDPQELAKYYEENNLMHSAKMRLTEDKLFGQLLGFDKR